MKRWLFLAVLLFLPTSAWAQGLCSGLPHPVVCYAHETITVSNSAIGFTQATYQPAGKQGPEIAVVTLEGDNIRIWYDGTADPTASVGQLVQQPVFWICGGDTIRKFKAIRQTNDATISVSYCR